MRQALAGATELAAAVKPHLERAGIKPVFQCDQPGIVATRQAAGDIEYLFAVNATHDPLGDPMLGLKAVQAEIGIPDDGRPVYDAILGGPDETFSKSGIVLQGQFRFGPGQMRVFARTTRPIGSIRVGKPVLKRSYTRNEMPLGIDIGASLLDKDGKLLSGSAPLRIVVTDPLGVVRFDLYRATANGVFTASLPLAVNDPAGVWKVEVEELLANSRDTASFEYGSVGACGATAGATWRAVYFGRDHENIKRFVRSHQAVTIVKGTTDYCAEAANRLKKILKPWDVECKIVEAGDVNKARKLTEQEARTWIGLNYAGRGQIKAGNGNPVEQAGFAMRGHVVLIGNPDDNPLIAYLLKEKFLPYRPNKDNFPGPGRGMLAWQRDAIGANQESVALIAYDVDGMSEAVGSFYEAGASTLVSSHGEAD